MPLTIDDIKKLPNEEKLKIIDEIWESIEEGWEKEDIKEDSPEVISLLEERLEEYEKGNSKSYSWEEVEQIVKKNLEENRNAKK